MPTNFAFVCTDGSCTGLTILYFVVFPFLGILGLSILVYMSILLLKRGGLNKLNVKYELKYFAKTFLIILGLCAVGSLVFIVIPTVLKDNSWQQKQVTCAREAGYYSPAEDNSFSATAESQATYRLCLDK